MRSIDVKDVSQIYCQYFVSLKGSLQQLLIAPDVFKVLSYCKDFTPDCDTPLPYAPFLSGAAQQGSQPSVQIINNVRYVSEFIFESCFSNVPKPEYPHGYVIKTRWPFLESPETFRVYFG